MKSFQIARPYIDERDISGVVGVLRSGWLSSGPKYKQFEDNLAAYVGSKYGCVVSSGTAALHLSVRALGLKRGDEVITSPFSFVASSNSLLYEDVKPVFVDIEEITLNMDPSFVESKITKKTKAILVVHIFGQSADMDPILKVAKKYHLKVLEDACESLGSVYKGRMTGTMGDIGTYAFYPNKQMTTGEGGMIVTNSKDFYETCGRMRNQGRSHDDSWLVHDELGFNYRMDEMSASLGITQLEKLDWMIGERRKIASWYNTALKNVRGIETPTTGNDRTHSYFVYVVRVKDNKRDRLIHKLAEIGIQTKPYLPGIHLQPFMKKMFGLKEGDLPITERVSRESLALPLYIGLAEKDVEYIVDKIGGLLDG